MTLKLATFVFPHCFMPSQLWIQDFQPENTPRKSSFGEISGCSLLLSSLKVNVFATKVGHLTSMSSSTWVGWSSFQMSPTTSCLCISLSSVLLTLQLKLGHSVHPRKKDYLNAVSRRRWLPSVSKLIIFFTSDFSVHYGVIRKGMARSKCLQMKTDIVKRKLKLKVLNFDLGSPSNWNPFS